MAVKYAKFLPRTILSIHLSDAKSELEEVWSVENMSLLSVRRDPWNICYV